MSKSNHSQAQMVAALKQMEAGRKAEDVAREVGVSKHTLYSWKAKYGDMDVSEAQEVKQLRDENARLKFQYDGFSNLTAKVLNGTPQPLAVNPATNWLNDGQSYDANGNMTSGAGGNFTYDEANRVNTVAGFNGGDEQFYGYDASNKRIYVRDYTTGTELLTFYGAQGEKLGVYSITSCGGLCVSLLPITTSVWFAGRLVMDSGTAVYQDRLGTNRAYGQFYPFGEGITATTGTNTVMFAGYLRDSYTGVDYANQRFYASTYGRFNTPDPSKRSGGTASPASWNKYA